MCKCLQKIVICSLKGIMERPKPSLFADRMRKGSTKIDKPKANVAELLYSGQVNQSDACGVIHEYDIAHMN